MENVVFVLLKQQKFRKMISSAENVLQDHALTA